MGRILVAVGLGIALIGVLMMFGMPFGRLPGDLVVRRGRVSFYLPLATSLVVSILLTILFAIFRR